MGDDVANERKIKDILQVIEFLRIELEESIETNDRLTNESIIKKSQELDKVLSEYYKLLHKTREEQ
ncbi:MAG: Spo0E family sporulation regulatory protein-aspartic acid phosphatase [Bacillota bacterium]